MCEIRVLFCFCLRLSKNNGKKIIKYTTDNKNSRTKVLDERENLKVNDNKNKSFPLINQSLFVILKFKEFLAERK